MNRDDTVFLKFVAIILVLNSHLDLYYPIAHLGTGGAIGNALFFMLSSFGLLLSEKMRPQKFLAYLRKRVTRIYPAVWIVLLLFYFPLRPSQPEFEFNVMIDCIGKMLYPPFWFLKALVVYYLIGFFLIKDYTRKKIFWALTVSFVAYLYFYFNYLDLTYLSVERTYFKLIFYFIMFMFGIFLADFNEKIKYTGIGDVAMWFGSIFILYGHKLLMAKQILSDLQFVQQLILLMMVYYALKLSRSPFILDGIMKMPVIEKIIRYVSGITLELYIVHATISPFILDQKLSFPVNVAVFLGASFCIATFVKWAVGKVLNLTASWRSMAFFG